MIHILYYMYIYYYKKCLFLWNKDSHNNLKPIGYIILL